MAWFGVSFSHIRNGVFWALLFATLLASPLGLRAAEYIGVDKCRKCHKSDAMGKQYQKWQNSDHASAYQKLASESAHKIASSLGLGDPQHSGECLECHTTVGSPDPQNGVTCEACHGPGSQYSKVKMLNLDTAIQRGLVPHPEESVCVSCHNGKCPTGKEAIFDYASMVQKIAHSKSASDPNDIIHVNAR